MKTRNGFVSNSSSSSFCILGVTTDEIQCRINEIINNNDWHRRCTQGLVYEDWICECDAGGVMGIDPDTMVDSLTVEENKELVAQKINGIFQTHFNKNDISFIADGGYQE